MTLRRALTIVAVAALLLPAAKSVEAAAAAPVTLRDLGGSTTDLDSVTAGRPTLLVIWATWCPSCAGEVPRLKEVESRFGGEGLNVVAVNPAMRDDLASVRRYAERYQLSYPVYLNPDHSVLGRFGVHATPTLILLDASGREVARSHEVDEAAIARLLAGSAATGSPGSSG